MNEVVARVLQSVDRGVGEITLLKVQNYVNLLASVGKTEEQLVALGQAYLNEILNPDPRYSGC